jgi:acetone carboxylase gamma subunit
MDKRKNCKNLGKYMEKGGPGRPKCGRSLAIETLDKMLAEAKNQARLKKDMQAAFDKNSIEFVYKFAYPLMPRNVSIEAEGEKVAKVVLGITFEDDAKK